MKPVATVPPDNYGTDQWVEWRKPFEDVATKRGEADPVAWADNYLRHDQDAADLRALGRCLSCAQPITLRQYRGVVISEPCGHYRAHGRLEKIGKFQEARRRKLTPERRAALLELVGGVVDEKARRRQLAAKLARETPFSFDDCRRFVDEANGDEAAAMAYIQARLAFNR